MTAVPMFTPLRALLATLPVRAALVALITLAGAMSLSAQGRPLLEIDVTGGVSEPVPFAVATFVAENAAAQSHAQNITEVISANLAGTGLFREIPRAAHIARVTNLNAPVEYASWRAINAQALVTGAVSVGSDGRIVVQFRLFDIFSQQQIGEGVQYAGRVDDWRRMAHKVSDTVYARLTGESGYFDSRIVFVAETGPKDNRRTALAIMDQDGANLRYLTDDRSLVMAPRFSPNAQEVLYTSYESGRPQVILLNVDSGGRRAVFPDANNMSFGPRFSPDGRSVVMSVIDGGNTDIYRVDLGSGSSTRLTTHPGIDTAPSFSPDGSQIVFESDRGGTQQLYIMPAGGGEARRISFGEGRYATPVWSPRGDMIAFTKIQGGRFHIGVMRVDGSMERLLTGAFHDEAPTWSPNGRVLMFFRLERGDAGATQLFSVDMTGRNLRQIRTQTFASDPAWSGLLP